VRGGVVQNSDEAEDPRSLIGWAAVRRIVEAGQKLAPFCNQPDENITLTNLHCSYSSERNDVRSPTEAAMALSADHHNQVDDHRQTERAL
jgi:hypothetical protein